MRCQLPTYAAGHGIEGSRESCALFHLRDGKTLARVRRKDQGEIRDALRRLGSSESEALLYKGSVSVEGIHDVEVLETGFGDLFRRYQLKDRGGRSQVEKDILELQKVEIKSEEFGYHYFVFDLDGKPTRLRESAHVKFLQLDRYCLENYLLDTEILTDLSRERAYSDHPKQNVAEMRAAMKALAMAQIDERVARQVFTDLGLERIAFNMKFTRAADQDAIAAGLHEQINDLERRLNLIANDNLETDFIRRLSEQREVMKREWEEKWHELCDGKRLFEDLREAGHLKGDLLKIKKAIIAQMRSQDTLTYKSLATSLRAFLGASG